MEQGERARVGRKKGWRERENASSSALAGHAEPIANEPSVEISKEVITTGPAQFLTVDARLPPQSRIDLNEEAMNILDGGTSLPTFTFSLPNLI